MKITPITPQNNIAKLKNASKPVGRRDVYTGGSDQVQISEAAQSFAAVYKAVQGEINNTSTEYQARVESIARRIQDGSYSVKSEDVAQKIIEDLF